MRKTHRYMELREGHYIVLYIDFKQPKTFSRVFLGFRGESSEIVRKKKQTYAEGRAYYKETTRSVCDKDNFILKSKQSTALIIEHSLLTPYLWLPEGYSCCTKSLLPTIAILIS